jgi:hypothetical protein
VFTPTNGTSFVKGDTVTLDASPSLNGYDTVTANESCPIVSYGWRVEYLNGTLFDSFNGKNASFTAPKPCDLRIILIVEAQDPNPPSSTSFKTSATNTSIIHVTSELALANLDVYTTKGGTGQNTSSGPYGPQALIKAYAISTYRNVSVSNIDVLISLKDSNGTDIAYRVARTNSSGIAIAEFRLPWVDTSNPESAFGNWLIVATATVSQYAVCDTAPFIFSYILKTQNVAIPGAVGISDDAFLNITINNINNAPVWTFLTVTIYDEQKVPVSYAIYKNTAQNTGNTTIQAKITIPTWAFLGQATVYINVLTESPENGGTPYCPERALHFEIVR